jgi:CRP/FNR family transcriptional regulator, cyclic AMP receptor protein
VLTWQELKSVKLFAGLPDSELKQMVRDLKEVSQPKGKELTIRGDDGVGFMVILEGEAEVTTPDGRKRVLAPGDYYGEMALLDQQGRSATVVAREDMRLAGVIEWKFKPFLVQHPEVAYQLLQTLSRRLREGEAN